MDRGYLARTPAPNLVVRVSPISQNDLYVIDDQLTAAVREQNAALQNPYLIEKPSMSRNPFDRLKDKLAKASGVAQRTAIAVEAEADALIAREETLKAKTVEAFSPHKAILDQAQSELDQVENALNQMSNDPPA